MALTECFEFTVRHVTCRQNQLQDAVSQQVALCGHVGIHKAVFDDF